MSSVKVHRLDCHAPDAEAWLQEVAQRMQRTLVEVLGDDRGLSMYQLAWLVARARWHLTEATAGAIFLATVPGWTTDGRSVGHTIVRMEQDAAGRPYGLFSTTFVHPDARKLGVASVLLRQGEDWLIRHGATRLATDTSATNTPLLHLYQKHRYTVVLEAPDRQMVRLARAVNDVDPTAPF